MRRRVLLIAWIAAATLLAVAALPGAQASTDAPAGGIFRVSFQGSSSLQAFDHIDPALAYTRESWTLLDTVCARLMRYRDRPPPAGYQLVPEVATAPPTISRDGKTTTFKLRSGFRFSDGTPVGAGAFAHAIDRTMAPGVESPAWPYTQAIVGSADVKAGKRSRAAGVTTRGNTLTVRFTREIRDFAAWTTMPFFCAVPPTLPPSPEGVRTFPGSGPYAVRDFLPDRRVVIRRNRYYGGDRAHHVEGFDVDLTSASPQQVLDRIEGGKADWGYATAAVHVEPGRRLIAKYGINFSRFFMEPGLTTALYVFNSSRPLFRSNPELRRAVNLALNRLECALRTAEEPTDQGLPTSVAGASDRRIYPLDGDIGRARAVADGHRRQGKLVFYVPQWPRKLNAAELVREELGEIGLEVEIRELAEYATSSAYLGRLGNPDEQWDMAFVVWSPDYVDPFAYLNRMLDAEGSGGTGLARFAETPYLGLMREAARRSGRARARAYASLDLPLRRDAAPFAPIATLREATLVSARSGCLLRRPSLVLTTVCLKR